MRKTVLRVLRFALVLLALVMPAGGVLAKGPPAKAIIEGPGLQEPVEVTDLRLLQGLSIFGFEDINRPIEEPANLEKGYTVTRYSQDGSKLMAWDRAIYYPGAPGEPGVVFYEGLVDPNMWSEFDGRWYAVTEAGEVTIQEILVANGVSLDDEVNSPFLDTGPLNPGFALAMASLVLLLLGTAAFMGRRRLREVGES
jgi:hypothetical protein